MDFLLIVFLTLLNGAFAMAEMALTASRRLRLQHMADAGDTGAAAALALQADPTRFLSTVQVGITSIGVLNGIVGEAAFSGALSGALQAWGLGAALAQGLATAIVVSLITALTIVFGELVPKRIAQLYPEAVARVTARPMTLLAAAASPIVHMLSAATQGVLRLLRVNTQVARGMTEEEINASLDEGLSAGLIEAQEHQMVNNVFDLEDRALASIMRPRAEIAWLDAHATVAQALDALKGKPLYQHYPVCRDGLDHVVGVLHLASLLMALPTQAQPDGSVVSTETVLADVPPQWLQSAIFVPETLNVLELLQQFKQGQRYAQAGLALVVDEYGVVQGLVTAFDLLEAITGELKTAQPHQAWATQRPDGVWALHGQMPIAELKNRLDVDSFEHENRYATLGGLLMHVSGRLLQKGDALTAQGWRFEVNQMQGRRIEQVLAQRSG